MLRINFKPVNNPNGQSTMSWADPFLTIDEVPYDLSQIPDGATVRHEVILSGTRTGDDYDVTVLLRHGSNAPERTRFPSPIEVDRNGVIDVPPYSE